MAKNRVIGAGNTIPWRLPGEQQLFKEITLGHHIIMGRNTWESIRRLLPGRTTVIVTRNSEYRVPGAVMAATLQQALAACGDDAAAFVIGGAQLYASALPLANRLYLTVVDAEIAGDTLMPAIDLSTWKVERSQTFSADERNPYAYTLTVYERD